MQICRGEPEYSSDDMSVLRLELVLAVDILSRGLPVWDFGEGAEHFV